MKINFSKIKQYIDSKINELPNVVRTGSYDDLEDKPSIPQASSTTPSADTLNGDVGNGVTWARSNHKHPKSDLYADAVHKHNMSDMNDLETVSVVVNYMDDTSETLNLVSYDSHTVKLSFINVPSHELLLVVLDENGNNIQEDQNTPYNLSDGFELPLQTYKQYSIQTGQYMQYMRWYYFYNLPSMSHEGEIIVDFSTLPQSPQSQGE